MHAICRSCVDNELLSSNLQMISNKFLLEQFSVNIPTIYSYIYLKMNYFSRSQLSEFNKFKECKQVS